jgi:hypothetical protein
VNMIEAKNAAMSNRVIFCKLLTLVVFIAGSLLKTLMIRPG